MTSLYKKFLTLFILFRLLSVPHGLEMGKFRPIRADIVLVSSTGSSGFGKDRVIGFSFQAIDTAVGDVGRSPGLLDVEVIQHFMRKITTAFPLSPEGSRMAVVEFATSARIRLTLSDGIDQKAIDGVYDELSDWYDDEGVDRNGPVDYYAMFRRINDDIFTGTNGDRPEIPNLLMVLTLVPSFENEDSNRWKLRARVAALGSMYNFTDPDGVVVTTSYASQTGTHHPKFTLTHGVGNFEPDAWHYQDFNNIMHYAVIHLRHAIRSAWVDRFYQEHEVRRVRTFDYTTCRLDPAIVFKVPEAEDYGLFVADIVFATEITRSAPLLHHDLLRTLVLNITRYLPISPNLIHFSAVEFDRESSNMRVVANTSPGSSSCCNLKSLFKSLIEKWAPQTSPRFRSLIQESARELISVEETGSARLNLRALSKTIQKVTREIPDFPFFNCTFSFQTLSQSSRIPQIFFLAVIYPHSPSLTSLDAWFRAFRKSNFAASAGYFDAIIVTSGNVKGALTYTVAVSPLVPSERLAWETSDFESVRGPLFEFVVNVTKAVVSEQNWSLGWVSPSCGFQYLIAGTLSRSVDAADATITPGTNASSMIG